MFTEEWVSRFNIIIKYKNKQFFISEYLTKEMMKIILVIFPVK